MQRKSTVTTCVVLLVVILSSVTAQATSSSNSLYGNANLFNPWNPATVAAVENAVERTLTSGKLSHGGALDGFSSWTAYADYSFGKSNDKRQGGIDTYFNSYTIGADALYNDTTLLGFMGNIGDVQGHNKAGTRGEVDSYTYSLYASQSINDWMCWGTSFSYSAGKNKTRGAGTMDTDNYVVAPYLTIMTQIDKMSLSLAPSYVLGYQNVNYPQGDNSDNALMGKLVLMGRAAYALTDKLSVAANLNFNQVLHSHGLDTENDPDHNWFTTGAKLNYAFTDNLSGSFGYSTEFDSDFDSDIWHFGLSYAF